MVLWIHCDCGCCMFVTSFDGWRKNSQLSFSVFSSVYSSQYSFQKHGSVPAFWRCSQILLSTFVIPNYTWEVLLLFYKSSMWKWTLKFHQTTVKKDLEWVGLKGQCYILHSWCSFSFTKRALWHHFRGDLVFPRPTAGLMVCIPGMKRKLMCTLACPQLWGCPPLTTDCTTVLHLNEWRRGKSQKSNKQV